MQYFTFDDEGKPVAGERFRPLVKDLRRIPVHVEEPSLDVPALQMVEQPVEVDTFFRLSLPAVAEQVIEVPKISCPSHAGRAALPEPQLVEQLVDVPTVLTFSLLQQRTAEQLVDNPAPHGRGSDARGGLQGLSQGQGSSAVSGAVHVNNLVPHVREEVLGEVFQASTGLNSGSWSRSGWHSWRRCSGRSSRPLPRTGFISGLWSRTW